MTNQPGKFQPTRWRDLRPGATIICPRDGQPERVTRYSGKHGEHRRRVHTDRHDHIRPADGTVMAAPGTGPIRRGGYA